MRRASREDEQVEERRAMSYLMNELWPPSFVPDSQRNSRSDYAPMMERIEWMHRARDSAIRHFDWMLAEYPEHERVLLSARFRTRLYRRWLVRGELEQLNGRVTTRNGDWGRTADLPANPDGPEVARGVLPRTWYRNFIDTVFVNAWVRWHALASYRAMQYFWTLAYNMARYTRELSDRRDRPSRYTRQLTMRLRQAEDEIQEMGQLLRTMSGAQSIPFEEFSEDPRASRIRREYVEKEIRVAGRQLAGDRLAPPRPRVMAQLNELRDELQRLPRPAELDWAESIRERGLVRAMYPPTAVRMAKRWGLLVPGANGGLFWRPSYLEQMVDFALEMGSGSTTQASEILALHDRDVTPEAMGPIRTRWVMDGPLGYLANFVKNPGRGPTRYDWGVYEARLNVELLRIPTVNYRLTPGFSQIIQNIWTNHVRIHSPPNVAVVLFDPPVRMRIPGETDADPLAHRVGYIGGMIGSTFRLTNARLAHPENLARNLELMVRTKGAELFPTAPSRIILGNVFYGPWNHLEPVQVNRVLSSGATVPGVVDRTLVLHVDSNVISAIPTRVQGGVDGGDANRPLRSIQRIILHSHTAQGDPVLDETTETP